MKKRYWFAILCIALMLAAVLPFSTRAAVADGPSGQCGDNLYWSFDEDTGTLTVTGSGAMYDYTQMSGGRAPWYSYYGNIETAELPSGLTRIGDNAFYNCVMLRKVSVPEGVTAIGAYAFLYCPLKENLVLPESLTSIGEHAFEATDIWYVTIPAAVASIGDGAFSSSINLREIRTDADNVHYTADSGVLLNKDKTELIAYPAGRQQSSYSVPDGVRTIRPYACSGAPFTTFTFADSLTEIGEWAFFGCSNLKNVTFGNGVTTIGINAFRSCTSLETVFISRSVASIHTGAFPACGKLTAFTVDAENPDFASADGVILSKNRTRIVLFPTGKDGYYEVPDGVSCIGERAFYWNSRMSKLTSIYLPLSVTRVEYEAFGTGTPLSDVYYGGSQTDRQTLLTIEDHNSRLLNAAWHYPGEMMEGTVEWNAEDVKYKGTTAYVIANGKAQTPRFTVKNSADGSVVDPANYDYEYKENTDAGTGYVIVTFKGHYEGTCSGWFKIYLPATAKTKVENVSDGIKVSWEPVEGADGYVIYRRAWSSTTNGWTDFVRWNNTRDLFWIDKQTYAGSRYQYGVKAYFDCRIDPVSGAGIGGNVGDNYNLGVVGPLKTTVRITTRTLNSVTGGNKQITAKWGASKNFTGYQVQIATNAAFTQNRQTYTISDYTKAQYTFKNLKAETTYYVRVRSYHIFEGTTYYGQWSNVKNAKTK
jgi:hypothetical protein